MVHIICVSIWLPIVRNFVGNVNIFDVMLRACLDPKQLLNHGSTLQCRHNERSGVSNHQPYDCLLSRLFMRRSKKTSKLRVTNLCDGNSLVTGEFPAQRASTGKMVPFDDVIMNRVTTNHVAIQNIMI